MYPTGGRKKGEIPPRLIQGICAFYAEQRPPNGVKKEKKKKKVSVVGMLDFSGRGEQGWSFFFFETKENDLLLRKSRQGIRI